MKTKSYTATIEVAKSAHDVFNAIKEVKKWWNKEDLMMSLLLTIQRCIRKCQQLTGGTWLTTPLEEIIYCGYLSKVILLVNS